MSFSSNSASFHFSVKNGWAATTDEADSNPNKISNHTDQDLDQIQEDQMVVDNQEELNGICGQLLNGIYGQLVVSRSKLSNSNMEYDDEDIASEANSAISSSDIFSTNQTREAVAPFGSFGQEFKLRIFKNVNYSKGCIDKQKEFLRLRRLSRHYNAQFSSEICKVQPHEVNASTLLQINKVFNNIEQVDLRFPFKQRFCGRVDENNQLDLETLQALSEFKCLKGVQLSKEAVFKSDSIFGRGKQKKQLRSLKADRIPDVVMEELLRFWMSYNDLKKL